MSTSEAQFAFGVVLFHSVQGAIRAEKILASAAVEHKLIPVPRRLSSNCGFCIRFSWTDKDLVEKLLAAVNLKLEGVEPL